jgi:hypothetical protein
MRRRTQRLQKTLALLRSQRTHVLFVLSGPTSGGESAFLDWYQGKYRKSVLSHTDVLSAQHYKRHTIDITQGQYAPLPYEYLGVYEVSYDGSESAEGFIEEIATLHRQQIVARAPATWLYYPVSEKVGRSPRNTPSMLTVAFANAASGEEAEFREWYATRHIRHALKIPALVSGQCFQRTLFQRPGALVPTFSTIAVYEQEGTPDDILNSFASIPEEEFRFPSLDTVRFAEWVYVPLEESTA